MAENHNSEEELREGSAAAEDGHSNTTIPGDPTVDSARNDQVNPLVPIPISICV